ncbi:uncharacterized protein LOC104338114 isoform X3 [Opisthocomus hoazin]|uniref:uncharacterized protein LOC104338114 isoform X3 n=1 Tax=Opisthocomus hoazin TaxID=30419 RepID=UPI003F529978
MAFVPDLDTLESSSLNDETFYGPDWPCPQKVMQGRWKRPWDPCDEEAELSPHVPFIPQKPHLDLELTSPGVGIQVTLTKGHPARTFRQAAVLVVAVTKFQKRPVHEDFADSDLGCFLDEIFAGRGELRRGTCLPLHPLPVLRHPRHRPEVLRAGVAHPAGSPAPTGTLRRAESEAQHRSVPSPAVAGWPRDHAAAGGIGHQGLPALHVMRDERRRARAAAGGSRRQEGHREHGADPLHLLPPGQPGRGHNPL